MFKKMFFLIGGIAAVVGAGVTAAVTIPVMSSSNANKVSQVETSKNEEIATLETKVSNLEATNASNEQTIAEQRTQIDELQIKADLSVEQEATLTSLRTANAKLNATNKSLTAEITELNQLLEDYQSGTGATGSTEELQTRISTLEASLADLTAINQQQEALIAQYKELDGPIDHTTCETKIANLQSQLDELQLTYQNYKDNSESENGDLLIQINSLNAQIQQLEEEAENHTSEMNALQAQCDSYRTMVEAFQEEHSEYARMVKAIRYNLFTVENLSQETVEISAEQVAVENQKINFRVPGFYDYYVKSNDKYIKNRIAIYGKYALYNDVNAVDTTNYGISIDSMNTSLIPTTKHQEYSYYEELIEIEDVAASSLYLTTTRKIDVENTTDFYEFGSASTIDEANFNKVGAFGYRDTSSSDTNTDSYTYYYIYTYTVTTYLSNKKVSDTSVVTTDEKEFFYTKENEYNAITGEIEFSYYLNKPVGSYVYYNENYTGINDGEECYFAIMVTIERSNDPTDYIKNRTTGEYIIDGVVYQTLPTELNYSSDSEDNLPTITPYETVVSKRKMNTSIAASSSQTADVYYFLYSQIFTYDYQEIKGDSFDKYTPSEVTGSETISIEKE